MSDMDWNTGDTSSMVSVATHKLYLSASGCDRRPGEPIVLLMQGMGSTISEWVAVKRLITPSARWVEYDRSGLGRSEGPPVALETITAASVAAELDKLLNEAGIAPPFVVVAHSWGGITSREFLHLRPNDIIGKVFVDANTENHFYWSQHPAPYVKAITEGVDYLSTTRLATEHKLSSEEWDAVRKETKDPRHQATEAAEYRGWLTDPPVLAAKKQFERQPLGNGPVGVLRANTKRDLKRLGDAGVAKGNGTLEERRLFQELLASWDEKDEDAHREFLKLSSKGQYQHVVGSGHNVQMMQPEIVAEEIKWVLDNVTQ